MKVCYKITIRYFINKLDRIQDTKPRKSEVISFSDDHKKPMCGFSWRNKMAGNYGMPSVASIPSIVIHRHLAPLTANFFDIIHQYSVYISEETNYKSVNAL